MNDKQTVTAGFALVALVLGVGILILRQEIKVQVLGVRSSIQGLPAGLKNALIGR